MESFIYLSLDFFKSLFAFLSSLVVNTGILPLLFPFIFIALVVMVLKGLCNT